MAASTLPLCKDPTMGLSDLPEEAVVKIIRLLDARQLTTLLVQDKRLRNLASDGALWQTLAEERWPSCSCAHYSGDWHLLFRSRAALPDALVRAADRLHAVTMRASNGAVRLNLMSLRGSMSNSGGGPGSPSKANVYGFSSVPYCNVAGMLLDEAMQAVFTVGLALAAGGRGSEKKRWVAEAGPEVARFKQDVAWWLAARPEVMVRFVRRAADSLREYDMWGSGYSSWPDVPWRRSALQFVLDLHLGPDTGVCISVLDRLQREAESLDVAVQSLRGEACHLDVRRPNGVPRTHWWYFLASSCS